MLLFFSMRLLDADDSSLTVSDTSIDELLLQIPELPSIYKWLCANKLTLNLKKKKLSTLSVNLDRKLTIIYYHHYNWQFSA